MPITLHTDFASLEPLSAAWNDLTAGVPFRRYEWAEAWWRNYCCADNAKPERNRQLFVLVQRDQHGQLAGIAPWYRQRVRSGAQVIHFLGDGEICSDHLTLLCRAGGENAVAAAMADWLSDCASHEERAWDRLDITGVDADDVATGALLSQLDLRDNTVHSSQGPNGWSVKFPATWDEYLMVLSKPHRNRLRQAQKKFFDSGRAVVHYGQSADELAKAFEILIKLHQERWQASGLPGCFASPSFDSFHREISKRFWSEGRAAVNWLELDGQPAAAEYQLIGDSTVYAYQSGFDIHRGSEKPGHLANMAALRRAIEEGRQNYDFLRGDEPYKAHWRAQSRRMLQVRVIPARAARLRHNAWLAGQSLKQWIKHGMALAHLRRAKPPRPIEPQAPQRRDWWQNIGWVPCPRPGVGMMPKKNAPGFN